VTVTFTGVLRRRDEIEYLKECIKMSRCNITQELEVHHKRRDGGNDIENAEVLCQSCHENTSTYGVEGKSPPAFSDETKKEALKRAGNRCECEKEGCHIGDDDLKFVKEAYSNSAMRR
jgi:5-methylcytosine-specific restriction endonuclease McrA